MSQKERAITSELAGVQGELSCTRIEQQKLLKQLHEERQANRDAQVQLQLKLAAERAKKEVSTDCGLWTAGEVACIRMAYEKASENDGQALGASRTPLGLRSKV